MRNNVELEKQNKKKNKKKLKVQVQSSNDKCYVYFEITTSRNNHVM